ncbi:MAG: glycosyltransferase, partial [Propionibacteriaceae bacterium]|nr:glycosyltransferase [Propionibacteriaceae bacterium]
MAPKRLRRAGAVALRQAAYVRSHLNSAGGYASELVSVVVLGGESAKDLARFTSHLQRQTYRRLELVIVADPAQAAVWRLAKHLARTRLNTLAVAAAGDDLGRARQAGVDAASGQYLLFAEVKNRLAPQAVSKLAASLRKTGSDFALARYSRLDNAGKQRFPPRWIRLAHADLRQRTTVDEFPQAQFNVLLWTRLFRRSFFDRAELPLGGLKPYEDQLATTRAYARATAFDVLPDTLFHWAFDSGQAMKGRVGDPVELRRRQEVAETCLDELRQGGHETAAMARGLQILQTDVYRQLLLAPGSSRECWDILKRWADAMAVGHDDVWQSMTSQSAAMLWLLQRDLPDHLEQFLNRRGDRPETLEPFVLEGRPALKAPFWDDPEVAYPPEVLWLNEAQLGLVSILCRCRAVDGKLRLTGYAAVGGIDPAAHPMDIQVAAVGKGARVALAVSPERIHSSEVRSTSEFNDYRAAGWTVELAPEQLPGPGKYTLEVTASCLGLTRTATLRDFVSRGSTTRPPRQVGDGPTRLSLELTRHRPVRVVCCPAADTAAATPDRGLLADRAELTPDSLLLGGEVLGKLPKTALRIGFGNDRWSVGGDIEWLPGERWQVRVPLTIDRYHYGQLPLPMGQYPFLKPDGVAWHDSDELVWSTPLFVESPRFKAELNHLAKAPLLRVRAPIPEVHSGPVMKRRLQDA